MPGTIDDRYFEWLYSLVGAVGNRNPARSYWNLMRQLYIKEFVWVIQNDDNRLEDGRDLRQEFLDAQGLDEPDPTWMGLGCSMLEMLIGLARRASFQDGRDPVEWFWEMLQNLGISDATDEQYDDDLAALIDGVLETVIYRTYAPNGRGGLFPLKRLREDQRKVELWYQLSAYLEDNSAV